MTNPMTDDRLERELRRYFEWETSHIVGAPTAAQVAARLSGAGVAPARPRLRLAWAILLLTLAALLGIGIAIVGEQPDRLVVVPSASALPSPTQPTPDTTGLVGSPCGSGTIQIEAAGAVSAPAYAAVTAPSGTEIAFANEESATTGSIVVAGSDPGSARVIANYAGSELQEELAVHVGGWSEGDGESLLVSAGHLSPVSVERNCRDMFLIRSDGSSVTRLTEPGPGRVTSVAALSPDGERIAFERNNVMQVAPAGSPAEAITIQGCGEDAPRSLAWSPDSSQLLVACYRDLVVWGPSESESRRIPFPSELFVADTGWAPGRQAVVAAVVGPSAVAEGAPLITFAVDLVGGSLREIARTDIATEWFFGAWSMSPNARWVVGQGDLLTAQEPFPTYAIDVETGAATKLPWPVLMFSLPANEIAWLPDGDTLLTSDGAELISIDLARLERTELGPLPSLKFALRVLPSVDGS